MCSECVFTDACIWVFYAFIVEWMSNILLFRFCGRCWCCPHVRPSLMVTPFVHSSCPQTKPFVLLLLFFRFHFAFHLVQFTTRPILQRKLHRSDICCSVLRTCNAYLTTNNDFIHNLDSHHSELATVHSLSSSPYVLPPLPPLPPPSLCGQICSEFLDALFSSRSVCIVVDVAFCSFSLLLLTFFLLCLDYRIPFDTVKRTDNNSNIYNFRWMIKQFKSRIS